MITNKSIYARAIYLIDDPDISNAYANNIIQFQKIMYPFLENGVSIITAPTGVSALLSSQTPPQGQTEVIDGTGESTYVLSVTPLENSDIVAYVNNTIDTGAVYSAENNSITFSIPVATGVTAAVEWYYGGAFTGDFSTINGNFPLSSLEQRVIDLLARATVISWADKERNFLLDIRNLLNDTDFQLHSPANSLRAKTEWVKELRLEIFNLQNKLDWDLRNRNRSYYGY